MKIDDDFDDVYIVPVQFCFATKLLQFKSLYTAPEHYSIDRRSKSVSVFAGAIETGGCCHGGCSSIVKVPGYTFSYPSSLAKGIDYLYFLAILV